MSSQEHDLYCAQLISDPNQLFEHTCKLDWDGIIQQKSGRASTKLVSTIHGRIAHAGSGTGLD